MKLKLANSLTAGIARLNKFLSYFQWLKMTDEIIDNEYINYGTGEAPVNGLLENTTIATFDGVAYLQAVDLSSLVIAEWNGSSNPTIDYINNRILFTSGYIEFIKFTNKTIIWFQESSGDCVYSGEFEFEFKYFLKTTQEIKDIYGEALISLWEMDDSDNPLVDSNGKSNAEIIPRQLFLQESGIESHPLCVLADLSRINWYLNDMSNLFSTDEGYVSMWLEPEDVDELVISGKDFFQCEVNSSNRIIARPSATKVIEMFYFGSGVYANAVAPLPITDRWVCLGFGWSTSQNTLCIDVNGIRVVESNTTLGTFVGTPTKNGIMGFDVWYSGKIMRTLMLNEYPSEEQIYNAIEPRGLFTFTGDSRSTSKPWQGQVMDGYKDGNIAFNQYGFISNGVAGDTIADMTSRANATNSRMLAGKKNILVVWAGVNSFGLTSQQLYDGLKDYCTQAKSAGWYKVIICTEIDAQSAINITDGWPTKYLELNTKLRDDYSFADDLADLGAKVELQDATDLTYFNVDQLHPTVSGYDVIAEVVDPIITSYKLS